jgi:hypothetical protein
MAEDNNTAGKKVGILAFWYLRWKKKQAARMMHNTKSGIIVV